jgi:hypothetical protein
VRGPTVDLRDAVVGRVDRWLWRPGLNPTTVAAALDTDVAPGEILYAGHPRQAATIRLADQQWPLWAVWDLSGELVLIEVPEPAQAPTGAEALEAFGEPDARIDRTRGPYPGYEQLAYLGRGFTLFAWGPARPAYLWLYRPIDFDAYVADLGATVNPTRSRG